MMKNILLGGLLILAVFALVATSGCSEEKAPEKAASEEATPAEAAPEEAASVEAVEGK